MLGPDGLEILARTLQIAAPRSLIKANNLTKKPIAVVGGVSTCIDVGDHECRNRHGLPWLQSGVEPKSSQLVGHVYCLKSA